MECMRQYTSELLDFIADMHTLTKLKVRLGFMPSMARQSPRLVSVSVNLLFPAYRSTPSTPVLRAT